MEIRDSRACSSWARRSYEAWVTASRRATAADASWSVPTSMSPSGKRLRSLVPARLQIDDEIALECIGDPEERVDPRGPASPLQPRDRRLGRADQLGELTLGQPSILPTLGDLVRHRGEEPATVGGADSLLQALECALVHARHCRNAIARRTVRSGAGRRTLRGAAPRRPRGTTVRAAPSSGSGGRR